MVSHIQHLSLTIVSILICCAQGDLVFNVPENVGPGYLIGNVRSGSGPPPYGILDNDFNGQLVFDVRNGDLKTVTHLDRETKSKYKFTFTTEGGLHSVVVNVDDTNDNPPKFSKTTYNTTLPEDSPVGQQISLGSVSDDDSDTYSITNIEITKGNVDRTFKLTKVEAKGLIFLRLILEHKLDYETIQLYDLEVTAYDGGTPQRSAVLPVKIEVSNLNDEVPTFDTTRYLAVVEEDRRVGSVILNVSASDKDLGEAGRISYFINHSRSDLNNYFSVDKTSGAVKLQKSLDFEKQRNHTVIVSVRDHGTPELTASVHVQINVRDVNDHRPQMRLEFLSDGVVLNSARVSESVNVDDFVARLFVIDSDSSGVDVKLVSGGEWFSLISPTRDNYMLTLRRRLDREVQSHVNISLLATDNGKPPLQSRLNVRVAIEDYNDQTPVFEQSFYSARIAVDSPINTTVVKVNASDEDSGDNGRIGYRLIDSGSHPWFKIDPSSGVISTAASLSCRLVTLVVQARDHGSPIALTDNATVQVSITGANMHTPVFSQSYYKVHVKENTNPGVCFYKFHASDADCGAGVAYHLLSDTSVALFRLEQHKGRLCVQSPLDHERKPPVYQLLIKATDKDSRHSFAAVDVLVEDVNDNRPVFVETQLKVTVVPRPAMSPVAIALAADADSDINSHLVYSMSASMSADIARRWDVNANTGLVSLSAVGGDSPLPTVTSLSIDVADKAGLNAERKLTLEILASDAMRFQQPLYRWTVTEGVAKELGRLVVVGHDTGRAVTIAKYAGDRDERINLDSYGLVRALSTTSASLGSIVLVVRATQGVNVAYAQVVVTVEASKSPIPKFERSTVQLDVLETTHTPSILYRFFAGLEDGRVQYEIISGASPLFNLNATSGNLWLMKPLDFELSTSHRLRVRASPPSGSHTAEMTLILRVLDANDHTPECNPNSLKITVPDSAAPGFLLVKINCTDLDKGSPNGLISYTMLASSEYNMVHIDSQGRLTLAGSLSSLEKLSFTLTIRAQDGGSPPRYMDVTVAVTVKDTNNMAPQFSQAVYTFWVTENSSANTPVGITGATDGDRGANSRIRYRISGTTAFTVNAESGALSTARVLDREREEQHEFSILAEDQGVPPLTGTASVTVTVLDVNDQQPQFAGPNPYTASLMEGLPAGTDVLVVSASDRDLGANGTVSYALEPRHLPFKIHAVSGLIVTTTRLDFEVARQYRLTVVARDGGHPAVESRRPLLVTVQDADESARLLAAAKLAFFVPENAPAGTLVGVVRPRAANITGRDLVYRLVSQGPEDVFFLDFKNGRLTTTRPLDREENSNYSLIVQALDLKAIAPPRSAIAQITVKVLDSNDNGPRFEDVRGSSIGNPLYISVQEEGVPGGKLFTFKAPDPDAGLNGTVAYSLRGDSTVLEYFNLGSVSGVLRVVKPIDRETVDQLAFEVIAQDQCSNKASRRSSALTVIVRVVDINDHRPTFVSPRGATVLLDDPVNTTVMHVVARDPDQGANGRVLYKLVPPSNPYFSLGSTSGLLKLASDLRLTEKRTFSLNITATDSALDARRRKTTWALFTVAVLGSSTGRGRPVFTQGGVYKALHAGTVMSGLAARQPLLTVVARGATPKPVYALVPGLWDNLFHVGASSGLVAVREGANLTQESYSLPVTATDPSTGLMALAKVEIQARPANLHSPAFEKTYYRVDILEERPYSSFIVLAAHDLDPSDRARLRYAIQSGNNDHKFILDPVSGRLSCVRLSRSGARSYRLVITATDQGQPNPLTGTTTVQVNVYDANDNAPVFTASRYSARLSEDRPPGTSVLNVTATDADEGENGRVWYQFDTSVSPSSALPDFAFFSIDSNTGEIRTAFPLDRERRSAFTLTVVASDSSREQPFSSVVTVDVTVTDVNDNAPKWRQQPFAIAITSSERTGSLLTSVRATDNDGSPTLVYRFLHTSEEFRMDPATGSVDTRREIRVVSGDAARVVNLPIEVTDGKFSTLGLLEITVGGPVMRQLTFSSRSYSFSVSEVAGPGSFIGSVGLANASVPVEFDVIAGNDDDAFKLDSRTGRLRVNATEKLDFEREAERILWVRARSGDKVGFVKVTVNLEDADDNKPKFAQVQYVAHMWEKAPANTFVARPVAVDMDSGELSELEYSFTGSDSTSSSLFNLDAASGRITVQHGADYYRKADYVLEVQARAKRNPIQVSKCTVLVHVLNRNNKRPRVPALAAVTVPENTRPGKEILQVKAEDLDTFPPLTYHLFEQPDLPFAIGLFSGEITLIKPLDYENPARRRFDLRITVSDSVHLVNTTLGVDVTNVNDNKPVFEGPNEIGVPLGTSADSLVTTLVASDSDPGVGPQFSLCGSLPSLAASSYTLLTNGRLSTSQPVSSSFPAAAVLCLQARDPGDLMTRRALLLEVTAANRHAPSFQGGTAQRLNVRENTAVGETVRVFKCTDEDSADAKDIRYSVVPNVKLQRYFSVVHQTGQLVLVSTLDREAVDRMELSVQCSDSGRPPRTATAKLSVHIDDVNDNVPHFLDSDYAAHVTPAELSEGLPRLLVRLAAEDRDQGANGRIRFQLLSGPRLAAFSVNASTGWVSLTAAVAPGRYSLVVEAADCDGGRLCAPAQRAFVSVTVNVSKELPPGPTFPASALTVSVKENAPRGTPVFRPSAHGAPPIDFSILPGKDATDFSYDKTTGQILTATAIDFESKRSYEFLLRARDSKGRESEVPVHVMVTDEDEFPPKFDEPEQFISVPGGIPKRGTVVARVTAIDADAGSASLTAYLLVNATANVFGVNPVTGEIFISVDLLSEDHSSRRRVRRSVDAQPQTPNATATPMERKNFTVVVKAWSGTLSSLVVVGIEMDYPILSSTPATPPRVGLSGTLLVLVLVVSIIVTCIIIFIVVFYTRRRCRPYKPEKTAGGVSGSPRRITASLPPSPPIYETTFDPLHRPPLPPRLYDAANNNNTAARLLCPTGSGRGSDVAADEELRMITRTVDRPSSSLSSSSKFLPTIASTGGLPDSGVQMAYSDIDASSQQSMLHSPPAINHVDYLARLGVGGGGGTSSLSDSCSGGTVFFGPAFSNAPPLGMRGEEITLRELERREEPMMKSPATVARMMSSLSPTHQAPIDDAQFRLDHLLNWTPSYQPLAQVFSEIARLKDEPGAVTAPLRAMPSSSLSHHHEHDPPPLLTDLPPQVLQPILQPSLAPLTEHEVQI